MTREENIPRKNKFSSLGRKTVPRFPGWWAALGPGVVWMALAQGSGELIWWPYIVAKYGLTFLFLLIPACLLQYPVTVEIGRYTLLTGESIFHGFIRLNRWFGIFLWVLMTLSFLWFGAFASAGGTAMAALTNFPSGWSQRGQTLFWGYASIAVFLTAILLSKVVYTLVERFMKAVAVITVAGLLWACLQPEVLHSAPSFLKGLVGPNSPMPHPWDTSDATKLLTAITFAGLGGFWILFVHILFPKSRRFELRHWYYFFLGVLTVITSFTMLLNAPGPLILTSAVIGFIGTVIFPVALYLLNHRMLAPNLPLWARPRKISLCLLAVSFLAYLALAVAYLWVILFPN